MRIDDLELAFDDESERGRHRHRRRSSRSGGDGRGRGGRTAIALLLTFAILGGLVGVAWYGFDRKAGEWAKHVIFQGQPARDAPEKGPARDAMKDFPPGTAGTGLEVPVVDMDGDGDLDLVCPGKSGLYWFENLGVTP